jgi:site-specific DNA-methyltransferase (adenine-specific)
MPLHETKILCGDCRRLVPSLGRFDFVFADPPFNIGHPYVGYVDRRDDFDTFTAEWIETCWAACDGVMALHGPDDLAEAYLVHARRLGMRRIAWVNWHYRFGQCGDTNWIGARAHCLIFSKRATWKWRPDAVLVDSDRATKYGDSRTRKTKRPGKRVPGTVWGVPSDGKYWGRVTSSNKERRPGHPNQLPERYLERLLLAYTDRGDRVLDPFAGSGTTATVAAALGRPCVTIDVSPATCRSVADRVEAGAVRVDRPAPEFGNPTDLVRESCGTTSGILPNRATLIQESSRESLVSLCREGTDGRL